MIKFFRRIRQRLLAENRFNKYLLYAIGEIILVVIGILIALQINNWNEESKEAKVEQTFLKRLKIDLEENLRNWNELIAFQLERDKGLRAFIKFKLSGNKDSVQSIFRYFNTVLRWDEITMNQVTFKEMQSSGQLDLIKSDSIKIKLLELDKLYQIVFLRRNSGKNGHDKYLLDPSIKKLDFLNYIKLDNRFKELHPKTYTKKEQKIAYKKVLDDNLALLNDKAFTNSLVGALYDHTLVLRGLKDARDKAQELLTLIEAELK